MTDAIESIARAVLYEGYILWPYRRSTTKNRQRWTFGGVYPAAYSRARGEDDRWCLETTCLLRADDDMVLEVRLRFLHVVERLVARWSDDALHYVDELKVGTERYLTWDEARERDVSAPATRMGDLLAAPLRVPVTIAAGTETEWLRDGSGERAGAIVRSWRAVDATLEIAAARVAPRLFRIFAAVRNTTPWEFGSREEAQRQALVSTHIVLHAAGGAFVSLTDPPESLSAEAEACRNDGLWPVLVGEEGTRDTLLAAPIILPDHPRIAPESPGDLFDGTEIDHLLILNILGLTDEERAEMRASDPHAREILDRCTGLGPEELMRLHGVIRDLRPLVPE
jgi:hypothetical protein